MATSPEKFLISSVLRDGDMTAATSQGVTVDMFHAYPQEWEWIEDYYKRYRKTPSKNAFLNRFDNFVLKSVNDTGHFASEVRKNHSRFMLTSMISDAADKIADGNVEAAVQLVHHNIVTVAAAMGTNEDGDILSDFDDVFEDVRRRVKRVQERGSSGIPTGFPTLDERTGGPQPGQLWIIGARLGEGKSYTMQRWATAAVMHGYTVQFDALEQTRSEVSMRVHGFLSSDVGKSLFRTSDLMQGRNFDVNEYRRFLTNLRKQMSGKLHIADASRGRIGLMTIASQIERNHPDIVFVDYLTLLQKTGSEWQDVAALSSGLKQMGEEYQVPVVAAAQLNREKGLGKEPPGPEALAQADAIGQDADAVITGKQDSPMTIVQKAVKLRNAAAGFKWYTEFRPEVGVFREVTHAKYLDLKDKAAVEQESARQAQHAPPVRNRAAITQPPTKTLDKSAKVLRKPL